MVVEDHARTRENLRSIIDLSPELECSGAYATSVPSGTEATPPDVILVDLNLGNTSGIELIYELRHRPWLGVRPIILAFTWSEEPDLILGAIRAGALGYLHKSIPLDRLTPAILEAFRGGSPLSPAIARHLLTSFEKPEEVSLRFMGALSPREREVLMLLSQAMGNVDIAEKLGISTHTVRTHLEHIFEKTGFESRAQAIAHVNLLIGKQILPSS